MEKVVGPSAITSRELGPPLSSREQEVIARAIAGASNKEIAHALGVAHATVRVLVSRAAAKLKVKTRAELIAAFREEVTGE